MLALTAASISFHDCVQPTRRPLAHGLASAPPAGCTGGLCVGMHNGPHEGGASAYPVGNAASGYTDVRSTMTVPELPLKQDGICYYIWTDIFFGDMSQVCLIESIHSRGARFAVGAALANALLLLQISSLTFNILPSFRLSLSLSLSLSLVGPHEPIRSTAHTR